MWKQLTETYELICQNNGWTRFLLLLFSRNNFQDLSVLSLSFVKLICPLRASSPLCLSHPGMFVCLVPGQFQLRSDSQTQDICYLHNPPRHRYHRNLCNIHKDITTTIDKNTVLVAGLGNTLCVHQTCVLTATVNMKANWGSGQAVDKVAPSTSLHIYSGVPMAAVLIEAGAHGPCDDAFVRLRVAAAEPDGCVGATVILSDAEGGHGIPGHASEAIPLSRHMAVTQGHAGRLVDVVICVPPGFIEANVGRAWVQGWGLGSNGKDEQDLVVHSRNKWNYMWEFSVVIFISFFSTCVRSL